MKILLTFGDLIDSDAGNKIVYVHVIKANLTGLNKIYTLRKDSNNDHGTSKELERSKLFIIIIKMDYTAVWRNCTGDKACKHSM